MSFITGGVALQAPAISAHEEADRTLLAGLPHSVVRMRDHQALTTRAREDVEVLWRLQRLEALLREQEEVGAYVLGLTRAIIADVEHLMGAPA